MWDKDDKTRFHTQQIIMIPNATICTSLSAATQLWRFKTLKYYIQNNLLNNLMPVERRGSYLELQLYLTKEHRLLEIVNLNSIDLLANNQLDISLFLQTVSVPCVCQISHFENNQMSPLFAKQISGLPD